MVKRRMYVAYDPDYPYRHIYISAKTKNEALKIAKSLRDFAGVPVKVKLITKLRKVV